MGLLRHHSEFLLDTEFEISVGDLSLGSFPDIGLMVLGLWDRFEDTGINLGLWGMHGVYPQHP